MEFNIESPFPFDLGDDLFPLPCLSSCIDIPVPMLQSIISPSENIKTDISSKPKNGRRRKTPAPADTNFNDISDESPHENRKKKIMHRDIERQRRQDMSALYSNLRSLLPLEYLKGKRSICDHMHEAIKYIGHMQSRIQQLSEDRDELKKHNSSQSQNLEKLSCSKRDFVVVRPNDGFGIQVVLDTATQHRVPVSNILKVLVEEEGLQVLSCISIKLNDRFLHTIQCQQQSLVLNAAYASQLHHKLTNLEYFPLD